MYYYLIVFMFGLIWGSFLNVLIHRLDNKPGIILGRSECPRCKAQLKWYDLLPLLSYIYLKGRCRYCHKKISFIYPLVELSTALVLLLFFIKRFQLLNTQFVYDLVLLFFLVSLIFFDYLYYIIPDKIVLPLIFVSLVFDYLFRSKEIINLLTSGLILGSFFAILYVASRGKWVGFGDAKLSLLIGLNFGYPLGFLIVVASIWIAAIFGLLFIALKKATSQSILPFGSFLSLISIIFLIFKDELQIFRHFF